MKQVAMDGFLEIYSDQSTGPWWAFNDARYIVHDMVLTGGRHMLNEGDMLTTYDKQDPKKVLWSGMLSFDLTKATPLRMTYPQGIGVPQRTWARWFASKSPATLVKAKK
ncbi:MAG: hypothetical protein Q7S28_02645 [bacterium]|nr:hypothetical protein [bacterium]